MSITDDRAAADRLADAPMTVVIDPGTPPYRTPPTLEVRGPLTAGRVAAALDHAASRTHGGRPWPHRLQRLGPGHHLLHVEPQSAAAADDPDERSAAFPAGLVADLLTACDRPAVPLGPAQRDLLRRRRAEPDGRPHWRALNAREPFDPAAVDEALWALARAHPLLGARIDTAGDGGIHVAPPVYEASCTVADGVARAREREAVMAASRRLDPVTGRTLCAVLLRGRRRLVVAHELLVDQLSLDVLTADLRAALARPEEELAVEDVRYPDWAAALPTTGSDPHESDRRRAVAEGRAAARAFRPGAPSRTVLRTVTPASRSAVRRRSG
ncbi:hypothetical protein [Streptomyces sp. NPDC048612]|uniref:hypothetical protein n=1 Tax=Streptomyces sp. NPDC048612 TaxID=3365579 RepID=UPI003714BED1